MATKDDDNPGLLAKVAKFVRNPGTPWGEGQAAEGERDSSYSKQMLKEMIERKRRNDFVRRREFDQLRKLRRRETIPDTGGRPSFFQSSMPSSPDDRAGTLKKIDEIEAQMSMQWWKTKQGTPSAVPGVAAVPLPQPPTREAGEGNGAHHAHAYAPTEAGALPDMPDGGGESHAATLPAPPGMNIDFTPSRSYALPAAPAGGVAASPAPSPAADPYAATTGFSASRILGFDAPGFEHDPALEEAAIHFANGDHAGAEAALLDALGTNPALETWMVLFDLYRATGEQDRFDTAAIDFAGQFGRSAPQWLSISGQPGPATEGDAAATREFQWRAPAMLGIQSVATLQAALAKAPSPWQLDWTPLKQVEPDAVGKLCDAFSHWSTQQVQLKFVGARHLEDVLGAQTPSGDSTVPADWWRLRMEVLRVMGRPDEFELVALDYCVTYEVSPPSWQPSVCSCVVLQEAPDAGAPGGVALLDAFMTTGLGAPASELPSTVPQGLPPAGADASLSGRILGDATEALRVFEGWLQPGDALSVNCGQLVRIDFSAAGSVLNWAAEREAEGCRIQFRNLHRLVAIFFNVIGINEHARVIARKD